MTHSFRILLLAVALLGLAACQSTGMGSAGKPRAAGSTSSPAFVDLPATRTVLPAQSSRTTASLVDGAEPLAMDAVMWDRMREGFQLRKWYNHPRVKAEMESLLRNPDFLARATERARRYLYYVVNDVEARNLPMELALLPIVESAYNPYAMSPHQASGLWQFVPGTARHYGLRNSWWYDGSRDVIASTDAALDYLAYLNQLMGNDWLLAIASYNAGEGTIGRAKQKQGIGDRDDAYWIMKVPSETATYVPRLLALAAIIDQPDLVKQIFYPVPNEPYFVTLDNTGGQIDMATASDLAKVPVEEMYLLNPGFARWATDPDGPHRLNVPAESAESFMNGLMAMPPSARPRWDRHQVGPGETLATLARKYNTTPDLIQTVNDLKYPRVSRGQYLVIPLGASSANYAALSAAPPVPAAPAQKEASGKGRIMHTVKPGDTFWSISKQHDVEVDQILEWNKRTPHDVLHTGEQLVIWSSQPTPVAPVVAARTSSVVEKSAPSANRKIGYKVRQGDTLYRIADRFNVSVQEIMRWNRMGKAALKPGQQLTLYVNSKKL